MPQEPTIKTYAAGAVAEHLGPWVVDAALAVADLSASGHKLYCAMRARGQNSGWAVLGDRLIRSICGFTPHSDAARRNRKALLNGGWLARLDNGRGGGAAQYKPTVPRSALVRAYELNLISTPDLSSGLQRLDEADDRTPDAASGPLPPTPGGAPTPDTPSEVNHNKSTIKSTSPAYPLNAGNDHEAGYGDDDVDHELIDRVAKGHADGKIRNLRAYVARTLRNHESSADDTQVERYVAAVCAHDKSHMTEHSRSRHHYPPKLLAAARQYGIDPAGRPPAVVAAHIKSVRQ